MSHEHKGPPIAVCPHCGHEVDEEEMGTGICSDCGKELFGHAPPEGGREV
jgi:DNA-directed RNA polymerase subunit RPC12/RpoP